MRTIEINNTTDLINFIELESTTISQAKKVVSKVLKVLIITDFTKEQLIKEVNNYVNIYLLNKNTETPIFLGLNLATI
jgi:hypothetical protein